MLREGPATAEPDGAPAPPAAPPTISVPSSSAPEPAPLPPTEPASTPPEPTREVANHAPADQSPAPQPVETPDPAPADAVPAKTVEPSAPETSPADSSVSRGDQTNLRGRADAKAALSNSSAPPPSQGRARGALTSRPRGGRETRVRGSLLIDAAHRPGGTRRPVVQNSRGTCSSPSCNDYSHRDKKFPVIRCSTAWGGDDRLHRVRDEATSPMSAR